MVKTRKPSVILPISLAKEQRATLEQQLEQLETPLQAKIRWLYLLRTVAKPLNLVITSAVLIAHGMLFCIAPLILCLLLTALVLLIVPRVIIDREGMTVATSFTVHQMRWTEVETMYESKTHLRLVGHGKELVLPHYKQWSFRSSHDAAAYLEARRILHGWLLVRKEEKSSARSVPVCTRVNHRLAFPNDTRWPVWSE